LGDITSRFGQSLAEQTAARQEQETLERERLAQQAGQFGRSATEQERAAAEQERLRSRELGDITSRFGQSLAEQTAARQEQETLERERLEQQEGQFGQSLAEQQAARLQQEGQFGQSLAEQIGARQAQEKIERLRIGQQGEQFGLSLGEQEAARLQQEGQFGLAQDLERERMQQQAGQFGRTATEQERAAGEQEQLLSENLEFERNRLALAELSAALGEAEMKTLLEGTGDMQANISGIMERLGLRGGNEDQSALNEDQTALIDDLRAQIAEYEANQGDGIQPVKKPLLGDDTGTNGTNGNGGLEGFDPAKFNDYFNTSEGMENWNPAYDLNADGTVNFDDFHLMGDLVGEGTPQAPVTDADTVEAVLNGADGGTPSMYKDFSTPLKSQADRVDDSAPTRSLDEVWEGRNRIAALSYIRDAGWDPGQLTPAQIELINREVGGGGRGF